MNQNKILTIIYVLLTGLIITTAFGCKKYPENFGISLRSRSERIANNWKVENYKVNGNDLTSLVTNYTEKFTKDGSYSYAWGKLDGIGSWIFQNNDKEVKLTGSEDQTSRTLVILKLEEKTFWYYYMDGNDRHELHLIENK